MSTTVERLNKAIKRLGETREERARRLGMSIRQLQRWQNGTIPDVIEDLEREGVITINADEQPKPEAA